MDRPPPHPYQLPPSISHPLARSTSVKAKSSVSNMTVTRSPSPTPSLTSKRNCKQNRSHSAGVYHDLTRSAPPTWRSRFSNTLRRSSRRSSNASDTTITSADAGDDDSEIEYSNAQILPVIRTRAVKPEPPKLVNIQGRGSGAKGREDKSNPKQSKKLLEYYGVEQGDEAKARRERMRSLRRERRSLFREEFGFGSEALPWGARGQEGAVRTEQAANGGLGEGLMKWYRVSVRFLSGSRYAFANNEGSAKSSHPTLTISTWPKRKRSAWSPRPGERSWKDGRILTASCESSEIIFTRTITREKSLHVMPQVPNPSQYPFAPPTDLRSNCTRPRRSPRPDRDRARDRIPAPSQSHAAPPPVCLRKPTSILR